MAGAVDKVEKRGVKKNGGKRAGSGRKPAVDKHVLLTVKEMIAKHATEEIEVQPSRTSKELVKKSRYLILLDVLFEEGTKKNIPAIKEYYDRTLGKVPQPIKGDPDDRTPIPIEISEAIAVKNKIVA